MKNKNENQRAALEAMLSYNQNFIPGIKTLIKELRGIQYSDTRELLGLVIDGLNWEIEIFNSCDRLVNKKGKVIDNAKMRVAVSRLGEVLREENYREIADCLENNFMPFVISFNGAAMEYLAGYRK